MALTRSRKCECGTRYTVLEHRGESVTIEADDNRGNCPACGSDVYVALVTAGVGIELGGDAGYGRIYPYFDRGLGRHIRSAAHRRQVMKEMDVHPAGGVDYEREASRATTIKQERRARLAATMREYEESPEFAEYRMLRDKGAFKGDKFHG